MHFHLAAEGAGFEASSEKEYLVIDGQRSKHETYYEEKMKKWGNHLLYQDGQLVYELFGVYIYLVKQWLSDHKIDP